MTRTEVLIRLFEDSRAPATCRGCGEPIDFFETLAGKHMPMNSGAVPRKSEKDPATWRVIAFFSSEDTHWNTCERQADFRR